MLKEKKSPNLDLLKKWKELSLKNGHALEEINYPALAVHLFERYK
ncbi:hypothetical protein [Bacillus sp. FJAT-29814]|nr:hypothetical protein [Bacillus sp. FJAT-29814]